MSVYALTKRTSSTLLLDNSSAPTETVDGSNANAGGNAIGIDVSCDTKLNNFFGSDCFVRLFFSTLGVAGIVV